MALLYIPQPPHLCVQYIPLAFSVMPHRRSTCGSVSGRLPPSLIANQKTFRADTAQTIETESPKPDTAQQDASIAPPMPPRPPPFPQLLPGNSGFNRRSTRHNTSESFGSTPGPPPQPRPQIAMPTPFPFPQPIQIHPPFTPVPLHPHVPAEGVTGRSTDLSTQHEYGREHFHKYTADYTNRFDTIPSLHEDSESPHYESADISGGIHADVWPTYNKLSEEFDEKDLAKWNSDLDVLLIFVSLASERAH